VQCEERKWLRFVRKMIAAAEAVKKSGKGNKRQVIDKKGGKVPESARIVRCAAVNAYEVSGTLDEKNGKNARGGVTTPDWS
jgi:hypothetical protein